MCGHGQRSELSLCYSVTVDCATCACLRCLVGYSLGGKGYGSKPRQKILELDIAERALPQSTARGFGHKLRPVIYCPVVCVSCENSCLTSVCSGHVEAGEESYRGSAQTAMTYLCAWHLAPIPLTNMTNTRKQRASVPSSSGTTVQVSRKTEEEQRVLRISGFRQATAANANGQLSLWLLPLATCKPT